MPWLGTLLAKPLVRGFLAICVLSLGSAVSNADCNLTNLSIKPLNELGLQTYQGFSGGLYPNGANNRPATHLAAGLNIASNGIKPLDASGNVDTNSGKIAVLSSGMSNTTQEWASKGSSNFRTIANADPSKNSQLVIVDGAIGGEDAPQWTNINSADWRLVITQRLVQASVTTNQIQIMWLKQAIAGETGALTNHARLLQSYLEQIVRNAKSLFPNLKIIYLSGRTRAYVYGSGLNPEPYAFETGFAPKWMIEKQINGAPELNYDATKGPVVAPWLSWGPYLWADGAVGRSDGLLWLCSDVESDFTHPSPTGGVPKVAQQLLAYFKTDPTATPWFLKKPTGGLSCTATADVTNGTAPLTVQFGVNVTGSFSQVAWTFDDGGFAFGQTATKTFPSPGTYAVHATVTATNGNTASTSVTVTVNTMFNDWRSARFSASELTNSAVSGVSANPDGDKLPNLLEYALGCDPKQTDSGIPGYAVSNGVFTLSIPHFKAAADIAVTIESSTDLSTWISVAPSESIDNGPIETLLVSEPLTGNGDKFFRLKATRLP